jgi:hypothetical protein
MSQEISRKKLRKQPKRRRVQSTSAVNLPQLKMPKTADKRRRRKKTEPVRFGLSTLKRFIFSSRWISLGLLIISIYALVDIYNEQRFYLTYIPVEGSVAISPEEIAEASGLAGRHAFAADPSEAAKKIGEIPGIISATVTLRWPNQVFIAVNEEVPVAIWAENGKEFGVTQSGRLIPAVQLRQDLLRIESESDFTPFPIVGDGTSGELSKPEEKTASGNASAKTETGIDDGQEEQLASLAFIPPDILNGAMQLHALQPAIETLYYKPAGGLSYEDERGWRGYFGTGMQMNQKLVVYEAIVADLKARGIQPEYISVSNQEKPYYGSGVVTDVITDTVEEEIIP